MSSTVSQLTVKIFKSGGAGCTFTPILVTTPELPSQPLNRPSSLGSGRVLCQAFFWMAQEPTLTSSPVGKTTSMEVISWLCRP